MAAALWRKHRLGDLSAEDAAVLVAASEWDWLDRSETGGRFAVLRVTDEILSSAARSLARHPLRAYDAVQLASAMAARQADGELVRFACFDRNLSAAAAAEGFVPLSR